MKHNKSYEMCMFNQMKPIFATHFLRILQGQASGFHTFISLLKRFTVFNILRYHGPYLGSYKFDRLDAMVYCFCIFPPELTILRTEIISWFLKVKYLLDYFR